MIRRFLTIVLAGVTLALGAVVTPEPAQAMTESVEAPAHNFNADSLYTCAVEEPPNGNPSPYWTVRHSHPVALTEAYVDYACCAWDGAREVRYWATLWWNGATNAHGGYNYGVLGTDCY